MLAQYSPAFRLGATVEELRASGNLEFGDPYDRRVSAAMDFPAPVGGMVSVLIAFRMQSDSIRPTDTAIEYILYSDSATAMRADSMALRHLARVLGSTTQKGCMGGVQSVLSWSPAKGGAALYHPARGANAPSFARDTKLAVFASHASVEDFMGNYQPSPCP